MLTFVIKQSDLANRKGKGMKAVSFAQKGDFSVIEEGKRKRKKKENDKLKSRGTENGAPPNQGAVKMTMKGKQ